MPGAVACGGFGMCLYDDAGAGVFLLRKDKHLAEPPAIGGAGADRGIAAGLVDDQHVARFGQRRVWIDGGILGQMRAAQPVQGGAGAGHQRGIVERMGREQRFQLGRRGGVEMHAGAVDQQAYRRLSVTSGMQRAQEGILDPDQRRAMAGGDGLAAVGGGRLAPDAHGIALAGQAERHPVAGQRQDSAQARLGQETAVVDAQTPGSAVPGVRVVLPACGQHGIRCLRGRWRPWRPCQPR